MTNYWLMNYDPYFLFLSSILLRSIFLLPFLSLFSLRPFHSSIPLFFPLYYSSSYDCLLDANRFDSSILFHSISNKQKFATVAIIIRNWKREQIEWMHFGRRNAKSIEEMKQLYEHFVNYSNSNIDRTVVMNNETLSSFLYRNCSANGFAWIVMLMIFISCSGRSFASTGTFSIASSTSSPSISLNEWIKKRKEEKSIHTNNSSSTCCRSMNVHNRSNINHHWCIHQHHNSSEYWLSEYCVDIVQMRRLVIGEEKFWKREKKKKKRISFSYYPISFIHLFLLMPILSIHLFPFSLTTSICIWSPTRHCQHSSRVEFYFFINFIIEISIRIHTCASIPFAGRVAALQYKLFNRPMKQRTVVVVRCSEGEEVVTRTRSNVDEQFTF